MKVKATGERNYMKHEPSSYSCQSCESSTNEKIKELEEENSNLRKTLEKYANDQNFLVNGETIWELIDNGDSITRQLLGTWAKKALRGKVEAEKKHLKKELAETLWNEVRVALMDEVKVGQVYFSPKDRENLVITFVDNEKCSWITEEGKVGIDSQKWLESCILKVEYPTWQEAIKWEFKK